MQQLILILENQFCSNLLSALWHSLWQGLLIAALLFIFLKAKLVKSENARYSASIVALAAIVLCVLSTFSILNYEPAHIETTISSSQNQLVNTAAVESSDNRPQLAEPVEAQSLSIEPTSTPELSANETGFNWKPPVLVLWFTGVIVMLFRVMLLIAGGTKLQIGCSELKDQRILEIIERLRQSLKITRKIRVAVSEHISVPGVIGFVRPILFLPASMLTGVPIEDLQAILAHELAHIKRYDYLVNFFQMVIEAILFFNPAVWWISRQIRIEREICCDNAGIATIGRRIRYAEVLIGWAKKIQEPDMKLAATAMGFGKKEDSGSMLERIQRIVGSEHRTRLKVSWHIAAITLLVSFVTLTGLWQGTNMTVAFAGKLLTPQERIDRISEISKEYGYSEGKYGEDETIQISGTIKTWDDKPLPPRPSIMINISNSRNNSNGHIGISKEGPLSSIGTFNEKVQFGTITLLVTADGYAPVLAGPFDAKPNQIIENIELVLQKGYTGKIKVVNEAGNSVESANITGGYPIKGSYSNSINLTTDANGIAVIEHTTDIEIALTIDAEGFELYRTKNLILKPDEINVLEIAHSQPVSGIVISKATGQPIEGAKVWILISRYTEANHTYSHGKYGEPEAISDENGRFSLTKLRSYCRYLVLVEAEDYFRHYLSDLQSGTNDIKVELGPEKTIHGRIIGNLEKLDIDKNGTPIIRHTQHFQFANSSSMDSRKESPVIITNGIGNFEITECWGQKVTINAGNKKISVNVDKDSLDDVLIDLSSEDMREVVLNFNVSEGKPAIEGDVRIDYCRADERSLTPKWLEIINNQALYEIPVPGRFKYGINARSLEGKSPVGYWFNEITTIDIPAGNEPYIINVPVYPAGAIYGTVRRADGTVIRDARVGLSIAEIPETIKNSSLYNTFSSNTDMGTFNITPLPLGGKYGIIAYEDKSYGITDIITLDETNPIVEIDITVPKGFDIKGRLLDSNDNPVRIPITINIDIKRAEMSYGVNGPEIWPDEDGWFIYENVNPGPYGKCSIIVKGRKGYRSAEYEIKDLSEPIVIQLKDGLRATGVVLDEDTGWPVPGIEVSAYRTEDENGNNKYERIEAEEPTNENGEFVFTNMADAVYNLYIQEFREINQYQITGGQTEPVIVTGSISDWSELEPRKPD